MTAALASQTAGELGRAWDEVRIIMLHMEIRHEAFVTIQEADRHAEGSSPTR